jgi:squalene-hopene/tetraprenyl-beta-curcumene cyclase
MCAGCWAFLHPNLLDDSGKRIAQLQLMINALLALSLCADWNPRLAAEYLDGREKEWFAWKAAQTPGGPCVSCHTNVTYLLVRPALRKELGEQQPTAYEIGLRDALKARIPLPDVFSKSFSKEPLHAQSLGVESIHAALLLGSEEAFDRMWALQLKDGKEKGAWNWFHLDLDPWETPESTFYGATLAALAVRNSTEEQRATHREQIGSLIDYLKREQSGQPLHNRLMLLWAMPEAVADKKALLDEVWKKQAADGGWSIESLGPWKKDARSSGSEAYATGLTAYVLLTDHDGSNKRMDKALNWLKSHQNREHGFWTSSSMNKDYPPDSMMVKFMQDAATGFAAMALLEAER